MGVVEDRKAKVKKGWLVVTVGLDNHDDRSLQRFSIPITHLHHPYFRKLLEAAHEAYGYAATGPLRLPCSVQEFQRLRWLVEHESQKCVDSACHRIVSIR
ncbi:hypothetical protein KSP39_PZI010217 [Platanthera zijinensis]|uniref:Uncharacterized protein n=1 Tax=Platanthera zijinensis TaxID=2320716 RepID=A0AAP0BKG0_9ASPA